MTQRRLWLLLTPYVGLLWVAFYNFRDPTLSLDVSVGSICIRSNLGLARVRRPKPPKVAGLALMRMNIWIILAALLALLAITRYAQQGRDTRRI